MRSDLACATDLLVAEVPVRLEATERLVEVLRPFIAVEDFPRWEFHVTSTNMGNVAAIRRSVDCLATKTSMTIALAFKRLPPADLRAAVRAVTAEPQSTAFRVPSPGIETVLP